MSVKDLKEQIRQQREGQQETLNPSSSKSGEDGYRAFSKTPRSGCQFLKLLFASGHIELVPYSLLGLIRYAVFDDAEKLLFAAAGQQLEITGLNLEKAVDLLQYRECAYFQELDNSADVNQFAEDEPAVVSIRWLKMEKPSRY